MRFNQKILLGLLLILLSAFFTRQINLTNSDIGRHIKNGELFINESKIISSNFYSYTEPDFPVVNHHWGAGVIFYKVWRNLGFDGLSILNILINVLAFLLFYLAANKMSSFKIAFSLSLLAIPLLTSRFEIRPETFSCLFLGIYYLTLINYASDRSKYKKLYLLPILQILWVNIHIFFILGIFIIGVYWINNLLLVKDKKTGKHLSIIFALSVLTSLINPYGINGLTEPFFIMREYGYMVAENQSVPFMQSRFPMNFNYILFESMTIIAAICFFLVRKNIKQYIPELIISVFIILLSFRINRVMNLWALFFIPIAGKIILSLISESKKITLSLFKWYYVSFVILIIVTFIYFNKPYNPVRNNMGIGLVQNNLDAAGFLKKSDLQGLIFNNYDIGGYLIFSLYPKYKVFVDNRPEAYSVSFFRDIYVPMQENEKIWLEMNKKYYFQGIFFYRLDMTPWAQPFLIRRLEDPEWVPVFVDDYVLILLKNNGLNAEIIRRYQLPKSMFIVTE